MSNVPYTQTECADKLGISLIEFKQLAKRVEGRAIESDLVSQDEFDKYQSVYQAEKTKPAKAQMQIVKPELSHDNNGQSQATKLTPDELYKQAYQAGIAKARMAFAIQNKAFQTHLDALMMGQITPDENINPDDIAREIAQIEQSLKMGN
jgi:hypothetical protein